MRALFLVVLAGCNTSEAVPDAMTMDAAAPDATTSPDALVIDAAVVPRDAGPLIALSCADVDGVEVCSGVADPTALGPGVEAVAAGIVAGEPGVHWYCRPAEVASWNGSLLLHLVGTYGDPRDDHRFPERACAMGYAAITPMYENRDDARSTCGDDPACYDAYHAEVVDGVEGSPLAVDADDAIVARSRSLLTALRDHDIAFGGWATTLAQIESAEWPAVVVSGHSQGSGHALYIARDRSVRRLVILAGPADQLRDGAPDHAPPPWIEELAARTATPVDRFYAYIHLDDSLERIPQVFASWDAIGLGTACDFQGGGGYDALCRRILIPSDDCLGLSAHLTVVARSWGAACRIGAAGQDNLATWTFLLE